MDWELTSRVLVVTLYAAAAAFGTAAYVKAGTFARKRSSLAIVITATCWIVFYMWLLAADIHVETAAGHVSRIVHYVSAIALTYMASQIWDSERAIQAIIGEMEGD